MAFIIIDMQAQCHNGSWGETDDRVSPKKAAAALIADPFCVCITFGEMIHFLAYRRWFSCPKNEETKSKPGSKQQRLGGRESGGD